MASPSAEFPINGGSYPPYGVITDDDHGSFVVIAAWIFASISVLFAAVRILLRSWTSQNFGWDNILILVALLCAIAVSVSASESVAHGLGRHIDTIGVGDIRSYYRANLATDLLSFLVFVLCKLSLVVLLGHITPSSTIRLMLLWFTVFLILWGLSGVFSLSFQCGARVPMRFFDSMCVNEKALYFTHGIINILTDLFILALPAFILWKVHMRNEQRFTVLSLFWTRIAVCVAVGIELGTMEPYFHSEDPTWDYLNPSLWNQITTHLSIITACIPSIKPFLNSLQSSLIDSGIPRNFTLNSHFELRPWRSTLKTFGGSTRKFPSSLKGMGLSATTYNEIEGGVDGEQARTRGLTDGVIHQQRDVDVTIQNAPEGHASKPSDASLLAYKPWK
ncbi:hypothetical protein F5Y15DRAFT_419973 [Xylariaceae sp. FL0016]|nr:hypothetical protein F5Y15DRAFT_419973 [Xylariaceae sp. FL0016]